MSNIQLQLVQLHVSAQCIGHHQIVLRLVEQLYNKRGILEGCGGVVVGRGWSSVRAAARALLQPIRT